MHCFGIIGIALQWFARYFSDWSKNVSLNDVNSKILQISYVVLQGSILGPLLIICFIHDNTNTWKLTEFIMFADDTII